MWQPLRAHVKKDPTHYQKPSAGACCPAADSSTRHLAHIWQCRSPHMLERFFFSHSIIAATKESPEEPAPLQEAQSPHHGGREDSCLPKILRRKRLRCLGWSQRRSSWRWKRRRRREGDHRSSMDGNVCIHIGTYSYSHMRMYVAPTPVRTHTRVHARVHTCHPADEQCLQAYRANAANAVDRSPLPPPSSLIL